MTALYDLLTLPTTQRLGWTLLHFIWQGALIAILCGLLLRLPFARNARAAYAVCMGGLLLCVLAPTVTFICIDPVTTTPVGLVVESEAAIASPDQTPTANLGTNADVPDSQLTPIFIPAATDLTVKPVSVLDLPPEEIIPPAWHERLFCTLAPYVPWLVVGWFPLALLLSLRLGWQWGLTRSWVHSGKALSLDETGLNLARLSERLGVKVRVRLLETARVAGPLTVGFLKPVILVPVGVIAGMSPAHIEAILLHELAHIRRWDYLVNLLASVVTALLFYHPVVWWLQRRAQLAREMCCDELAATRYGDRPGYAQALAQLEVWRHRTPALAASDGSLLQRIRTLAGQRGLSAPSRRSLANFTAIFVLTLGASLMLQSSPLADADESATAHLPHKPAPSGQVIGMDGKPVAGAQVVLYHMRYYYGLENSVVETVETDPDGRFAFSNELIYDAWQGDQEDEAYYVVAWDPNQAAALAILGRDATETQDLRLTLSQPEPRTVHVTDKDGQPVAGATVNVHSWSIKKGSAAYFRPAFGPLQALTNSQGIATFSQLPKGNITFAAEKTDYAPNWSGCGSVGDTDTTICLRPGASIEGRVVDPEGQPIPDVLVYASPTWPLHDYVFTHTDADGKFRLEGLYGKGDCWSKGGGTGEYRFGVEHPEYCSFSGLLKLKSGQTKSGDDLVTWKGTPVSGILLDPVTRQPIAGAQLGGNTEGGRLRLLTDAEGRFTFLAPPGHFSLSFRDPPAGTYVVEDYIDRDLPHFIDGDITNQNQSITLYAPSALGSLIPVQGRILTASGEPAVGARIVAQLNMPGMIEFDGSRNDGLRAVKSEADGIYHIPAYPAGLPMRLVVSWKSEATVTEISPVKTANAELPTVTLQKARSIRVRIVDLDGHPLANTKIYYGPQTRSKRMSCAESLPPVSHPLLYSVKTDADGNVTFKGIPPGYACDFWLPDDYYSWKRILPDQLQEESLPAFTLSDKLRIRFLDTQGKPMQIDQIKNGTWGLNHNYYRTGHSELSHDGLSPEDIAADWYTIPKEELLFQGPGAEGQVWAETPDGAIREFTGVFPQFDNTIVLRESRPVQLAEPAVTPPFDIPENAVAYLVVDESGQPISGASLTTDQHQNEHLSQTDKGSGWYLLEWPSYHYAPGYLTFSAPGYAPQWTVNIAIGEGRKIVLAQNTHLSGQLHAPDGSSPGVVDLTLLATRVRLYADGTPREVTGLPYSVKTDAEGRYDFPVSPGRYAIQGESDKGWFLNVKEFNIASGQTLSLPDAMTEGATLTVVFTDSVTHEPAEGVEVGIWENTGVYSMQTRRGSLLTSDARGRITWESLPPRLTQFYLNTQHRTEASMPYTRWWSPQNAFNAMPPPDYDKDPPRGRDGFWSLHFDLVPGEQTIPVTVERGIHLSGKIILPEDFPANRHVSATIVPVRPGPTSFSGDSREDISVDRETGTFSVWMPAGNGLRYRVLAFYRNPLNVKEMLYLPAALSEPFDSKPGDTFTFELSMLGGGWVTGRVVNTEGQPQSGLRIAGIPTDHAGGLNEELEAITDADGRFTMGPLRATEYGFIPEARRYQRKADYYKHQKLGTVTEGETTDLGDTVFDDEILGHTH